MRYYVDKVFDERVKPRRKRNRIYDNARFSNAEETAPIDAPRWTITGYNSSLKNMVEQKTNRKDTFVDSESTVDNHNIENVEDETMNGK